MSKRSEAIREGGLYLMAALCFLVGYGDRIAAGPGFEAGERAAGVVRIATWNVGGAANGKNHALRTESLAHVAAVLSELDPDLVVLQELGSFETMRRLRELLGPSWKSAYEPRGSLAAFARRGELWHESTAAGLERTILLTFEPSSAASELVLMGVHANAFDAEARNRAIGRAVDALRDAAGERAHVLLGDLNLDVDLDTKRDLFSNRAHLDVETYNFVAARLTDAALGRGSTAEPDRRLDYLFVSESCEVLRAGPWKSKRTGTMDHDPVVADLRFGP